MYRLGSSYYFARCTHIFEKSEKPFGGSGLQIDREATPSNTSTFAGQKFSSVSLALVPTLFWSNLLYSWVLVTTCRPVLQILTRFQTKKMSWYNVHLSFDANGMIGLWVEINFSLFIYRWNAWTGGYGRSNFSCAWLAIGVPLIHCYQWYDW